MHCYCDLQGFFVEGEFIIKEFALLGCDGDTHHFIFKQPFPINTLTKKDKKTVAWLQTYHGFSWNSGTIPYNMVWNLLNLSLGSYYTIYVKGEQKVGWLQKYVSWKNIINIENLNINF